MKTICWNCSNFIWIWLKNRMKSYTALENRSQTGNGYSTVENDREFSDDKLTEDTAIVDEVIGQYNDMKSELEP